MTFTCLETGLMLPLYLKTKNLRKQKKKIKHIEEEDVRETHLSLLKMQTYKKR